MWEDELHACEEPPFTGVIAFTLVITLQRNLAVIWFSGRGLPVTFLELFVEFRNLTHDPAPWLVTGWLEALTHFGLDGMTSLEKDSMRDLVLRGGPWNTRERSILTITAALTL